MQKIVKLSEVGDLDLDTALDLMRKIGSAKAVFVGQASGEPDAASAALVRLRLADHIFMLAASDSQLLDLRSPAACEYMVDAVIRAKTPRGRSAAH